MTKKILLGIVLVAALGIAYYTLSPLFITIERNDEFPQMQIEQMEEQKQNDKIMKETTGPEILKTAPIVPTPTHPASGTVHVIKTGDKITIRYEDYETINGPDLFVYLATDLEASTFVNLGAIKATKGNVNYEVPADVDISQYKYVLTWCRAFSVLFNSAEIN